MSPQDNETPNETVETPAADETPVVETPAAEGAAPAEGEAPAAGETPAEGDALPPVEGDEAAAAAAAAWKPNSKFKVLDQEHEIDKTLIEAIKTPEQEAKFREIYEKAFGLDVVKPKYQELKTNFTELKETHDGVLEGIQDLRGMVQRKDFDGFFDRLKIPQEMVLQWMVDKINYNELPPEQKQIIDARKQAEQRALEASKQTQDLQQRYQQQASQAKGYMLNMALERAEIRSFADAYDAREGRPGAFRDAVCDFGEAVFLTRNVDLTPDQAIGEVMKHYGKFLNPGTPGSKGQAPAAGAPGMRKEPPTIPNVGGRQTSPAKNTQVASIDDLRKIRKQMLDGNA